MKPSVDIYLDEEHNRFDTNIEFYIDSKHSISVSIDTSGNIIWAYLWGEYKDHGSNTMLRDKTLYSLFTKKNNGE